MDEKVVESHFWGWLCPLKKSFCTSTMLILDLQQRVTRALEEIRLKQRGIWYPLTGWELSWVQKYLPSFTLTYIIQVEMFWFQNTKSKLHSVASNQVTRHLASITGNNDSWNLARITKFLTLKPLFMSKKTKNGQNWSKTIQMKLKSKFKI